MDECWMTMSSTQTEAHYDGFCWNVASRLAVLQIRRKASGCSTMRAGPNVAPPASADDESSELWVLGHKARYDFLLPLYFHLNRACDLRRLSIAPFFFTDKQVVRTVRLLASSITIDRTNTRSDNACEPLTATLSATASSQRFTTTSASSIRSERADQGIQLLRPLRCTSCYMHRGATTTMHAPSCRTSWCYDDVCGAYKEERLDRGRTRRMAFPRDHRWHAET